MFSESCRLTQDNHVEVYTDYWLCCWCKSDG